MRRGANAPGRVGVRATRWPGRRRYPRWRHGSGSRGSLATGGVVGTAGVIGFAGATVGTGGVIALAAVRADSFHSVAQQWWVGTSRRRAQRRTFRRRAGRLRSWPRRYNAIGRYRGGWSRRHGRVLSIRWHNSISGSSGGSGGTLTLGGTVVGGRIPFGGTVPLGGTVVGGRIPVGGSGGTLATGAPWSVAAAAWRAPAVLEGRSAARLVRDWRPMKS